MSGFRALSCQAHFSLIVFRDVILQDGEDLKRK